MLRVSVLSVFGYPIMEKTVQYLFEYHITMEKKIVQESSEYHTKKTAKMSMKVWLWLV
jgi:hypothetical protein